MSEAIAAVAQVTFDALVAGVTGAAVYGHAPMNSAYPMVVVGDTDAVRPLTIDEDPDRRMTITVLVLTEGEEKAPCVALLAQVEAALGGRTLIDGNWSVALTLDSASATLAEDGLGYVGLAQFSVLALSN